LSFVTLFRSYVTQSEVKVIPVHYVKVCKGSWLPVAQLVQAHRYKPEGAGLISDGVIGIFH
jgi:hypothetical protein